MNQSKNSEQVTTTTSSLQQQQRQQQEHQQSEINVIKSLKEFNRSQINKVLSIDNDTALNNDVDGTTHESDDVPQLTEAAGISKTVVCSSVRFNILLCVCMLLFRFIQIALCFVFVVEKISNLLWMGANANELQWRAHRNYWQNKFKVGNKGNAW